MNITGTINADDEGTQVVTGAFYVSDWNGPRNASGGGSGRTVTFDAARTWSGETSSRGSHAHSVTTESTGGSQGHTHTISSRSASQQLALERPPFYRMAFFVKLPE